MWQPPPRSPTPPPQVICQICETVQPPATVCAECGMPLKLPRGLRPTADPPIEAVPDLERTEYAAVGNVGGAPLPDFEPTMEGRVGNVPFSRIADFEPTTDQTIDLELPPPLMPDIELTADQFERTPVAPPTDACPFCGHVQASGKLCDNCGRSRNRVLRTRGDDAMTRCRACGARVKHHKLCSECGQPLPED